MRTKCYSVRVESVRKISDKAYIVRSFDGSEDIIPASQVFGQDYEVQKCDAYWISAWILEKKSIQYSRNKEALFDEDGNRLPDYTIERHKPEKVDAKSNNIIKSLHTPVKIDQVDSNEIEELSKDERSSTSDRR